jgi:hypothetical protein
MQTIKRLSDCINVNIDIMYVMYISTRVCSKQIAGEEQFLFHGGLATCYNASNKVIVSFGSSFEPWLMLAAALASERNCSVSMK